MTKYISQANGYDINHRVLVALSADGIIVEGDMYPYEVRAWLREHMQEGDTYQELYGVGRPFGRVLNRAELFAEWGLCDEAANKPDPDLVKEDYGSEVLDS